MLVKTGARLDDRDTSGQTALILAVRWNPHPAIISALLTLGADAKLKSNEDKTAVEYARDVAGLKGTDVYLQLKNATY
jgi:ankyrin repeat protein